MKTSISRKAVKYMNGQTDNINYIEVDNMQ